MGALIVSGSSMITHTSIFRLSRDIVLLGWGLRSMCRWASTRACCKALYDFSRLAINFVLEALIKFGGALIFLHYGSGVTGVIAAVVLSIAVAY